MISSAEEFRKLRESLIEEEYHRAAHEEASELVWFDVIKKYPEMKSWVAHNKTVPITVLEYLAKDKDSDVRAGVARKRKLSRNLFVLLSQDTDVSVLYTLAGNPKIPNDIFEALEDTKDQWLRTMLAEIRKKRRNMA